MKSKVGIALAVLAAALYAVNAPLSKLLLDEMPSTLMAGFLYLGAWPCAQDAPLFRRKKSPPQTDDANRTPPND